MSKKLEQSLLQKLLLMIWLTAIVNCKSIKVYDSEWCADLGVIGAHCAHTLTDQKRDILKRDWDLERVGYLCTNSTGFNDTETAIDQLCRSTNLCDYETRRVISQALLRLKPIAQDAKKARGDK